MSQVYQLNKFIPYVRSKLDLMGYMEHVDEYDDDNIAATIIDRSYKITPGSLSSSRSNHSDFEWTFPVTVDLWFRGFNKPSDALDYAIERVESFLDNTLDLGDRFNVAGLREIYSTSIDFKPLSESNDCIIQASIGLTAIIHVYHDANC